MMVAIATRLSPRSSTALRRIVIHPRFARILSVITFLVGWQVVVPLLPTVLVPTVAEVAEFMWAEIRADTLAPQTVYEAFAVSLQRLGVGFGIALLIGLPIGLAMGLSKAVNSFLHDFLVVGLAMPSLVWALLASMWFGFGTTAPVVTVVLAAVTFVTINVAEGVRDVPKDLLDMAKSYDISLLGRIRHVVLPSLMPFVFAALRYGIANGWKGLVLAEVFASTNGAGWTIRFWYDAHRAHGVVGYALFFLIFAWITERYVFAKIAERVFRWRPTVGSRLPAEPGEDVEMMEVEPEPAVTDLEGGLRGDDKG